MVEARMPALKKLAVRVRVGVLARLLYLASRWAICWIDLAEAGLPHQILVAETVGVLLQRCNREERERELQVQWWAF